jgi:uncharacterized membrane protein
MVLALVMYALTCQFPEQTLAFSPKKFPRFVSSCLFLLSTLLVGQGIGEQRKAASPAGKIGAGADRSFLIRLGIAILISYAYTRLLPLTGYVAATPFFIAGIMILFKERNWVKIAATSGITTGALYILFRIIFKVPLPRFALF